MFQIQKENIKTSCIYGVTLLQYRYFGKAMTLGTSKQRFCLVPEYKKEPFPLYLIWNKCFFLYFCFLLSHFVYEKIHVFTCKLVHHLNNLSQIAAGEKYNYGKCSLTALSPK